MTPLEMAYAYSTLANEGVRVSGTLAPNQTRAGGVRGGRLRSARHRRRRTSSCVSASSPPRWAQTAKEMLHLVVTSGTGKAAQVGDEYLWGKTGTTENYGDAWFAGGNEDISVAIWVGYADRLQPMEYEHAGGPVAGGTFPAEIFHDFMGTWLEMRLSATPPGRPGRGRRGQRRRAAAGRAGGAQPTVAPTAPASPGRDGARGDRADRHGRRGGPAGPGAEAPAPPPAPTPAPAPRRRRATPPPAAAAGPVAVPGPSPARQSLGGAPRRIAAGHGRETWRLSRVAEAPRQVDGLRDADALAEHDPRRSRRRLAREQLDRPVDERAAVQLEADAERLGELAGAGAEVLGRAPGRAARA